MAHFLLTTAGFGRLLVSYSASPRVEPPQKAQLTRPGSIICPVRPYFLQTAATETFTELENCSNALHTDCTLKLHSVQHPRAKPFTSQRA